MSNNLPNREGLRVTSNHMAMFTGPGNRKNRERKEEREEVLDRKEDRFWHSKWCILLVATLYNHTMQNLLVY